MKRVIFPSFTSTVIIALLCLAALAQQSVPFERQRGYLIGPGDVISVKVLGEPDFGFVSTINDDGMLRVPYPKTNLPAKCRTENELQDDVTQAMSKYLRNPMVNLTVTDRKSRPPTSVFGEVRQPQSVILVRETRLRELLAFVGGQSEDAGGMVQIFRTRAPICPADSDNNQIAVSGDVPYLLYSLRAINDGKEAANPVIYPGDVVMVQKALPIYVTGEVRSPQGIRLSETGTSLTQAIAMVGGVNREAKSSSVKVYRLKPDKSDREMLAADLKMIKEGKQKDIMLEPYDIVEVDKAKKNIGQIILDIAIGAGKSGISSFGSGGVTRILY